MAPDTEGIGSLLDTDLYKLTMQCAVLRSYQDVDVTYHYTNRTPDLKLTRTAFEWLQRQVAALSTLALTPEERVFLQKACPFLPQSYLDYLEAFRFRPQEQVELEFQATQNVSGRMRAEEQENLSSREEFGDLNVNVKGKWVETILYEIPLLVLVSEAYFRFSNTDWDYEGQTEKAYAKGKTLLENGCVFSEFGTRRRRSYHTQELVLQGLVQVQEEYSKSGGMSGKLTGTSNVHFAHKFNIAPIGTVAHEWFMGIAAITDDYPRANEIGLQEWVASFGEGTLSIALTDTFGTPQFLKCFARPYPSSSEGRSYAQLFAGVRQDSGEPEEFIKLMRAFYDELGIKDKKTIVFSDSLDVDRCLELKTKAEKYGFNVSFGVGTFLTNDFVHKTSGKKSVPLNIVIKISSAQGRPAVKISDNIGKNTGDKDEVRKVKEQLGYHEKEWGGGDERFRWGGKEAGVEDGSVKVRG